jgi:flagellar biosynthesis protein FlhF
LEQLLAKRSWQDSANVPAIQATVGQRLAALGLSKSLGGWISDNVRDDGPLEQQWDSSIQLLTSCLHLMEMDSVKKSKLVACVGATGSGKTTCVVKLARQAANEFGEQAVGVIALTNGASVEVGQLADHRVPAGIETRSATDKSSLSESIAALRGKERIFIDTSGLSFRDPDMTKQLEWLAEQIPPIRIMLVISAAAQMGTTRELLRRVGATRLDGAIITKVDEAVSLGGVIDTLIKRRLPLSLLVDNRDPDIVPLNTDPVVFVDRALALMNERQVSQSIGRSKYAPANAKVYA